MAISIDAIGCELVVGGRKPPALRPVEGQTARLVATFSFQHLAERAIYEGKSHPGDPDILVPGPLPTNAGKPVPDTTVPDGVDVRPSPPVGVRPSRSSRLVFAIPPDDEIEFSTHGILDALRRLEPLVHPLAQPGDEPTVGSVGDVPIIWLPGGFLGHLTAEGLVVARPARGMLVPDPSSTAGLALEAREFRRARIALAAASGVLMPRVVTPETPSVVPGVRIAGEEIEVERLFGPGGLIRERLRQPRARPKLSRPPNQDETSIEAPFRLVISPSAEGRWAHATRPVRADDEHGHVELWHSRLGTAHPKPDGSPGVDELDTHRRIVRAVWARDRETSAEDWHDPKKNLGHTDNDPFRTSLDPADRHMLVRQTSETWIGEDDEPIAPVPAAARHLWLSSLGAWLDLHGAWTTKPYSDVDMTSILAWDEIAPMGRDQYVRVVYPGYLYPIGHRAALVKITERKMKDPPPSIAGLYQRKFLVIGEPLRTYADTHDFPFIQLGVRPLVTPTIDDPGAGQDTFFWPEIDGVRFPFILDALDHESRPVRLSTPLLWVAEHLQNPQDLQAVDDEYDGDLDRHVAALGQKIAFAQATSGGDTTAEASSISLRGKAAVGDSRPHMTQAHVSLPAVQQLSGIEPIPIRYHERYRAGGFEASNNTGELWATVLVDVALRELDTDTVVPLPKLSFGANQPSGSDKAGGFLSPELPIRGLSRLSGTVGDIEKMATKQFDPATFLAGASPLLFGIVPLTALVEAVPADLLEAPNVVSEALDRVAGLLADLEQAKASAQQAVDEANKLVARAQDKTSQLQNEAQAALASAQAIEATVTGAVDDFVALLGTLKDQDKTSVENAVMGKLASLRTEVGKLDDLGPKLPPFIRNRIATITSVLREVLAAADLIEDLYRFVNGFDPSSLEQRFHFEWRPKLTPWPDDANPILDVKADSLLLAVDGRASGKGEIGVEVLAEIRDFTLNLVGKAQLVRIRFDHLSFKAGSSGKADVDVVIAKNEFVGILGFVETIKDLIPFDGFSDPPFLDVTKEGLKAGFTLELPSLAIGVFTLSNMSLAADVQVPFLGKTTSVGFDFCTRERPFVLAVAFLGGGGWFGIRIGPDKLQVLEVGLEAGAILAVDLGVASGSISAMIGIYMRLEGEGGSLTGYFRLRGEVDVLGLISASIELYLALAYQFEAGKMSGRASITVQVKVFVFSGSVRITAERSFAGSNGDPSFLEVMGAESGTSPAWSDYCMAFAGA